MADTKKIVGNNAADARVDSDGKHGDTNQAPTNDVISRARSAKGGNEGKHYI